MTIICSVLSSRRYDAYSSKQPNLVIGYHQNHAMTVSLEKGFADMPEKLVQTIEEIGGFENNPLSFSIVDALRNENIRRQKTFI